MIYAIWLPGAGCEMPRIELSGVPLENPMSRSGLQYIDDDDLEKYKYVYQQYHYQIVP